MPCNCGGNTATNVKWVFTDPSTGRQYSYNTEIEAKAAKIRAGGGGSITTAPK